MSERTGQENLVEQIIYSATDMILAQLTAMKDDLSQAMELCGGELSVGVGIKAITEGSATRLTSKVSFTKEKVSDKKKWMISNQETLPFSESKANEIDQVASATVSEIRGKKGK